MASAAQCPLTAFLYIVSQLSLTHQASNHQKEIYKKAPTAKDGFSRLKLASYCFNTHGVVDTTEYKASQESILTVP